MRLTASRVLHGHPHQDPQGLHPAVLTAASLHHALSPHAACSRSGLSLHLRVPDVMLWRRRAKLLCACSWLRPINGPRHSLRTSPYAGLEVVVPRGPPRFSPQLCPTPGCNTRAVAFPSAARKVRANSCHTWSQGLTSISKFHCLTRPPGLPSRPLGNLQAPLVHVARAELLAHLQVHHVPQLELLVLLDLLVVASRSPYRRTSSHTGLNAPSRASPRSAGATRRSSSSRSSCRACPTTMAGRRRLGRSALVDKHVDLQALDPTTLLPILSRLGCARLGLT